MVMKKSIPFFILMNLILFCLLAEVFAESICFISGEIGNNKLLENKGVGIIDYGSYKALIGEKSIIDKYINPAIIIDYPTEPYNLSVGKYKFDPLESKVKIQYSLKLPDSNENRYFILQFKAPIKSEWMKILAEKGIRVIYYLPKYAYLVNGKKKEIDSLKDQKKLPIRWSGIYEPAYKISYILDKPESIVTLRLKIDGALDGNFSNSIKGLGAEIIYTASGNRFSQMIVKVRKDLIASLSYIPRVIFIDKFTKFVLEDEIQSQITAGGYDGKFIPFVGYSSWIGINGISGASIRVAVCDTGIDTGSDYDNMHPDIRGRVAGIVDYSGNNGVDNDGHGTHCAGIVAGNGTLGIVDDNGYLYGMGLAPGCSLINMNALDYYAPEISELRIAQDCASNNVEIISNSWQDGYYAPTGYSDTASNWDHIVRNSDQNDQVDKPLIVCFSAGNDGESGSQTITPPHEAKNILTIGASESYRPNKYGNEADDINTVAVFSSRGPCEDGRIKPDLVIPGSGIASLLSSKTYPGWCEGSIGSEYEYCSGTSMACPAAAGASALVMDWWRKNHKDANASPAMLKAVLINTAKDMVSTGESDPIPNFNEGWGRIYLGDLFKSDFQYIALDQEKIFKSSGDEESIYVVQVDPTKPIKITLVWTDCPGAPFANPALVNDLDLILENGGEVYYGNNFKNGFSIPDGTRDSLNNIENVYLNSSSYSSKITVRAFNIAGNGVPENDGIDQDYALFISNAMIQSSKGYINFDRMSYSCNDQVSITLGDSDLKGFGKYTVKVANVTKNNFIDVDLIETNVQGIFQGVIKTVNVPDGGIFVENNDAIMVEYIDLDDGLGGTNIVVRSAARIDCEGPKIIQFEIEENHADKAIVNIKTDEKSKAKLSYWHDIAEISTMTSPMKSEHTFLLENLNACTTYYLEFQLIDELTNSSVDDNGGKYYQFETLLQMNSLFDDAESGEINFTHFSLKTGGTDAWHISSRKGYGSSKSWYCGNESGYYYPSMDDELVSKVIEIGESATLSFWTFYDTESGYDHGYIEIKPESASDWTNITPSEGIDGFSGDWKYIEIPLQDFGNLVQIRFRFTSDGSSQEEGWYIDNIGVSREIPCHRGTIKLDKNIYKCDDNVQIMVLDNDLNLDPNSKEQVDVEVASTTQTVPLSVTLFEKDVNSPEFSGSFELADVSTSGKLQVKDGDTITASYYDENNGTGTPGQVTASARTDCKAPEITLYKVSDIKTDSVRVYFETDEPAKCNLVDFDPPLSEIAASENSFSTTHTFQLKNLTQCTLYRFKIRVLDELGNNAVYDSIQAEPIEFETLRSLDVFSDDFDSGSTSFTHNASTGSDLWHISNHRAHSGDSSFYCGDESTSKYKSSVDVMLISPEIRIDNEAMLTFWQWYITESGYDYCYVDIQTNSELETLEQFSGNITGWEQKSYDLSKYQGQKIRVIFRFTSDESTTYEGWYIDDFKISRNISCHAGELLFDRKTYGCTGTSMNIELIDLDLDLDHQFVDSSTITLSSSHKGDAIQLILTETYPSSGIFSGSCLISDTQKGNENVLIVDNNDTITATYHDANDGSGNAKDVIVTANTDCSRPTISDVHIMMITSGSAHITWNSEKPGSSVLLYGTNQNPDKLIKIDESKNFHVIRLTNLEPCTRYFFKVGTEDSVGNIVIDDNENMYYQFVTLDDIMLLYEGGENPENEWKTDSLIIPYSSEKDLWHETMTRKHTGSYSWYCGNVADAKYVKGMDNVLISPKICLPGNCRLSFYYYSDFASNEDFGLVEASQDGVTWENITPFALIRSSNNEWKKMNIDLSNYRGFMNLRFRFKSGNVNVAEGWYIDDITIINSIDCSPTIFSTINGSEFFKGDQLKIDTRIVNPGQTTQADVYIVLEKDMTFFFYPTWTTDIDFENRKLQSGMDETINRIDVTLDPLPPSGIYTIYSFLTEPTTYNLVSTIDIKRFDVNPGVNYPPEPNFNINPTIGDVSTAFTFDASTSTDDYTPQKLLWVKWDFQNDGFYDTEYSLVKVTSHTFDSYGIKKVKLCVMDESGKTNTLVKELIVTEAQ
jgi:hypothetical protein